MIGIDINMTQTFANGDFSISDISGIETDFNPINLGLDDGDPVPSLGDFGQSTPGFQPTYIANGINGQPTIRFDGTDDWMEADSLAGVFDGDDPSFTVVMVADLNDFTGDNTYWMAASSSAVNPFSRLLFSNGLDAIQDQRRDDSGSLGNANGSGEPASVPMIITTRHAGTAVKTYFDGVIEIDAAQDVGTLTLDFFTLGAFRNVSIIQEASIDVARFAVYNRALSDAELNQIGQSLSVTYNTNWTNI